MKTKLLSSGVYAVTVTPHTDDHAAIEYVGGHLRKPVPVWLAGQSTQSLLFILTPKELDQATRRLKALASYRNLEA